jgi:hypothetical protein
MLLHDQVNLLAEPSQSLSEVMMSTTAETSPRLAGSKEVDKGACYRPLSASAIASLDALRAQLDYWWKNYLDASEHDCFTMRRKDDLDGSYLGKVKAANEIELGDPPAKIFVVVKGIRNQHIPSSLGERGIRRSRNARVDTQQSGRTAAPNDQPPIKGSAVHHPGVGSLARAKPSPCSGCWHRYQSRVRERRD